jgi:hypothetical protein
MVLGPPGADPVADHTWCCEHPEPWNYFKKESEERLLSGLGRVFRVDPVEMSWSLRIAEWAATDSAQSVLREILSENVVPPKARKRCERLLHHVGQDNDGESPGMESVEVHFDALVKGLLSPRYEGDRQAAAGLLSARLGEAETARDQVLALAEIVGMGHAGGDEWLYRWVAHPPSLSQEEETHLLLASGASGRGSAFAFVERALSSSSRGFEVYDVYETIRALMRNRPQEATEERLDAMRLCLLSHSWWKGVTAEERGQMHVVESALHSAKSHADEGVVKRIVRGWKWKSIKRVYQLEALGYGLSGRVLRRLRVGLRDPELFVRREAGRSLRRLGSKAATDILVNHVREQIIPGHLPFDIEGADGVRYAMDGVLEEGDPAGSSFLYDVFRESTMRTHDLPQRAALSLCFLGDDRCMRTSSESGLPELVQAAISPLSSESLDPLEQYQVRSARWIQRTYGANLPIPDGDPTHLERVHLSRAMVTWAEEEWPEIARNRGLDGQNESEE